MLYAEMLQECWHELDPNRDALVKRNVRRVTHAGARWDNKVSYIPSLRSKLPLHPLKHYRSGVQNVLPIYNQNTYAKSLSYNVQIQADISRRKHSGEEENRGRVGRRGLGQSPYIRVADVQGTVSCGGSQSELSVHTVIAGECKDRVTRLGHGSGHDDRRRFGNRLWMSWLIQV